MASERAPTPSVHLSHARQGNTTAARSPLVCAPALALLLLTAWPALAQGPAYDEAKAIRYANTRYALYFLDHAWTFAVLGLLAFTGWAARLCSRVREALARRGRRPWAARWAGIALLTLVAAVLCSPLAFVSGYLVEHHFGLSDQPLLGWLADAVKGLIVMLIVATPVIAFGYWLMRRTRWWPLWGTLAAAPLVVLLMVVMPVAVDPLFNRYEPLRDEALRERILALAHEHGVPAEDVYQVDKSRQTRKLNAYVTGLLGTSRIVLWDTLLEGMTPEEIESVLAHEIGHYVKGDVWKGSATAVVVMGLSLLFVALAAPPLVRRFPRLGCTSLDEVASLPLLGLLFLLAVFLLTPATCAVSRQIERQADLFGLNATQDAEAAISSLQKMAAANLSHPHPPRFIVFWLYDHPPTRERIEAAEGFR
ncbi:MAG: M48 family metallopeptidase [Armatimonadota bacterium]